MEWCCWFDSHAHGCASSPALEVIELKISPIGPISPIRLIGLIGLIRLIPYKNIHYSLFTIHYSASCDGVGLTITQDEQLSVS